jgi:hypothetical protein
MTYKHINFSAPPSTQPNRMIVSVAGLEKSGKTRFALTAPEPIYFLNLDGGTEGVIEQFSAKQITVAGIAIPDAAPQQTYKDIWEEYKKLVRACFAQQQGTVVIDTGTREYTLGQLAHFGRMQGNNRYKYGPIYDEIKTLIRAAYESGNMNAIWLHRMKPQYVGESWNGIWIPDTMRDTKYEVQANFETFKVHDESGNVRFGLKVTDCRKNANLEGATFWDNEVDFSYVLQYVVSGQRKP